MKSFAELLRKMGAFMGMGTFGLSLAGALSTGADPFWALLRAGMNTAGVLALFSILTWTVVPILGIRAEEETAGDSEPAPAGEPA